MPFHKALVHAKTWLQAEPDLLRRVGSRAYGYYTASSDSDFIGCVNQERSDEYWESEEMNLWSWSAAKAVRDAAEGWPLAIDLILLPDKQLVHATDLGSKIIENRKELGNKSAINRLALYMLRAEEIIWEGRTSIMLTNFWKVDPKRIEGIKADRDLHGYSGKATALSICHAIRGMGLQSGQIDPGPHQKVLKAMLTYEFTADNARRIYHEYYETLMEVSSQLPAKPNLDSFNFLKTSCGVS